MKIFVDTSVFGGVFDEEWSKAAKSFFEYVKIKKIELIVTNSVVKEIYLAPKQVKRFFYQIKPNEFHVPEEATDLAKLYIESGALRDKDYADAEHIASATIYGCSAIVSFNFKHIVNFEKSSKYNSVNLRQGYPVINVFSPEAFVAELL